VNLTQVKIVISAAISVKTLYEVKFLCMERYYVDLEDRAVFEYVFIFFGKYKAAVYSRRVVFNMSSVSHI
jgi:hypothetical protein